MIKVLTPMQVLLTTKEKLETEAIDNPTLQDNKLEGYLQALNDMLDALSEYF